MGSFDRVSRPVVRGRLAHANGEVLALAVPRVAPGRAARVVIQGDRLAQLLRLLPDVERYFAGGDSTVRGFDEDRLATEVIATPLPPLGEVTQFVVLPAGGNIRGIHNFDAQVRLTESVGSAIYLDTGVVTNSLEDFRIRDLRHSVGMAVRWLLPIGKLSISWAIPLDPRRGDNPRGRLHFNFGVQI